MILNRLFLIVASVIAMTIPLQMQAASTVIDPTVASAVATTDTASATVSSTVNLNNANATELQNLKGIGAGKAQAIVDYRNAHGAFKAVDELTHVKGFSKKTVTSLLKNNPNKIVIE